MNYTVTDTLLNDVLKYLGTRPYVEVFSLVQAIQQTAVQQATAAQTQATESSGETAAPEVSTNN